MLNIFKIRQALMVGGLGFALALAACDTPPPNMIDPDDSADPVASGEVSMAPAASEAAEEPGENVSGPFAVGDRIAIGDTQLFTVHEVTLWAGDEFMGPDEGNKIVSVRVEIEGVDPEGSSYNPFYFSVKDADGFEYSFSMFGEEPTLQSGNDLAAGDKVAGWVSFEVPAETTALTLDYQPDALGLSEAVRVDLTVPAE